MNRIHCGLNEPVTQPPRYLLRRQAVRGPVVYSGYDFDLVLEHELALKAEGVASYLSTSTSPHPLMDVERQEPTPPRGSERREPPSSLLTSGEGGVLGEECLLVANDGSDRRAGPARPDGREVMRSASPSAVSEE